MIKSQTAGEDLKESLRIGTKMRGKVLRHAPFGISVSLPDGMKPSQICRGEMKDSG
jgi:hypothetical protein